VNIGWRDPRSAPPFLPYALSSEDAEAIGAYCAWIGERRQRSIDIAIRRAISAAHSRSSVADRLVDAVIAWENLFGTSEGEPRLRISAAMAWLLEADAQRRTQLQGRLKRLYDRRSAIVHGSADSDADIALDANAALGYAVAALAALFRERPEVLRLSDGAARSHHLILQSGSGVD
jgi:Apea-like HEPN